MAQQYFKISLPLGKYSKKEKEEIAKEAIQFIKERTDSGRDINGKKFPRYSKQYINSDQFKSAGKSASKVNLQLSGDMLDDLTIVDEGNDIIKVGYEDGTFSNDKASWNANVDGDKTVTREFLGIKQKDLDHILKKHELKLTNKEQEILNKEVEQISDTLINSILSKLFK